MRSPRLLFAAPSSGSGKTTITCGVLAALKKRGVRLFSFKCGPDYIDPLFQESVIGVKSGTLDLFFSDEETLKRLYRRNAEGAELALIEGVMGYYDGLGPGTDEASTYRIARALRTPVVLIINARGQSFSALAELQGFLRFHEDSNIRGVIFNQMSGHVFDAIREQVLSYGIIPVGYVPKSDDLMIGSRHLGLVTPDDLRDWREKLDRIAELLGETLDFDALIRLSATAEDIDCPADPPASRMTPARIAVARDEAFCFLYRDNLALLQRYGADLLYFSPIHDESLPEGSNGLLLPGGYPELHAGALSENIRMRSCVAEAVQAGMPCLAECGGFMYLHRTLEDMEGIGHPVCGIIDAGAYRTDKLSRFGYVTLTAKRDTDFLRAGETIRGHEFHYFDSESCGSDMRAEKPSGTRGWDCVHAEGALFAGFPHLYYESNPVFIERFLRRCAKEV